MVSRSSQTAVHLRAMLCIGLALVVASFASISLRQSASPRSYEGMAESGGALTKAKLRAEPDRALATQTAPVIPTPARIYKDIRRSPPAP